MYQIETLSRVHDEWLEDARKDIEATAICEECGYEIDINEDYYNIEGYEICEDCLIKFVTERYLVRGE